MKNPKLFLACAFVSFIPWATLISEAYSGLYIFLLSMQIGVLVVLVFFRKEIF